MKHLGLFEGIGGFSLAARWMGWETVAWCEWNEYCQKVLEYHFPEAEGYGDITKTDFKKYANTIDILTGGFPCQPYSSAGKRLGKEDDRHLWPEMLRAIREIQPRWIVGENVHGLINWNGGLVLKEIKVDLEASGYKVMPPIILPAEGVGAGHLRERVWIIAHANKEFRGLPVQSVNTSIETKRERGKEIRSKNRFEPELASDSRTILEQWANRPVTPELYDGLSPGLDVKTFYKIANNGFGNAIVPHIAYEIFKTIEQYEQNY